LRLFAHARRCHVFIQALVIIPEKNDGATIHQLVVPQDVPVDGFWSISLRKAR
jgi:hypothetical protein